MLSEPPLKALAKRSRGQAQILEVRAGLEEICQMPASQVHRVRRGLSRRDIRHTMDSFYDHRSFRRRNRNLNSPSLSESRVRVRFSVLLGGVGDLFRTVHSGLLGVSFASAAALWVPELSRLLAQ